MIAYNVTHDALTRAEQATPGVELEARLDGRTREGGERWSFRLVLPHDEHRETYRRRGHSGQRIASVCWHGHRDFLRALFGVCPDGRVKSAFADYQGREGFESSYRETGRRNIGSMMRPLRLADACDCGEGVA